MLLRIIEDYKSHIRKVNRNINNKQSTLELSYNTSQNITSELMVDADRDRINQAVSNLLNNAIKFTSKKGGTISLTTEKRNGSKNDNLEEVVINVVDTGEGIDREILPRLFTKFASKSNSGTGLGLSISKSIIEAHGGRM